MAPRAFLFDLEGTLYVGDAPVPGAADVIAALRRRGTPFRLCSNTTSRSRAQLVARLARMGIAVAPDEVWTAPLAAAALARERGHGVVLPLLPDAAHEDLEGLAFDGAPGAVIVGDLGARWTYLLLQVAFTHLQAGAELIACSRDRYYRKDGGLALDAGPFVAALEYATRREAIVAGKPSASFFRAAAARMPLEGVDPRDVVMVGDDLWSDVEGAQRAGFSAWAVETGKFRREDAAGAGVSPDRVLASVADLLGLLS
jgi:HAD superfamily hydrolase (TIGR01458 family)